MLKLESQLNSKNIVGINQDHNVPPPNGKGVEHSINTHLNLQHNKNNNNKPPSITSMVMCELAEDGRREEMPRILECTARNFQSH